MKTFYILLNLMFGILLSGCQLSNNVRITNGTPFPCVVNYRSLVDDLDSGQLSKSILLPRSAPFFVTANGTKTYVYTFPRLPVINGQRWRATITPDFNIKLWKKRDVAKTNIWTIKPD